MNEELLTFEELALAVFTTEQEAGLHKGLIFEQWLATKTESKEKVKTLEIIANELIESYKGKDYLDKRNNQVAVEKMVIRVSKLIDPNEKIIKAELSKVNLTGTLTENYNGYIHTKDKIIKLDTIRAQTNNVMFGRYTVREVKN